MVVGHFFGMFTGLYDGFEKTFRVAFLCIENLFESGSFGGFSNCFVMTSRDGKSIKSCGVDVCMGKIL